MLTSPTYHDKRYDDGEYEQDESTFEPPPPAKDARAIHDQNPGQHRILEGILRRKAGTLVADASKSSFTIKHETFERTFSFTDSLDFKQKAHMIFTEKALQKGIKNELVKSELNVVEETLK